VVIGVGWGLIYWLLGEELSAWIPGTYGILTGLNILVYRKTKRFKVFRFSQLLFFLVLPFLLQWTLGGYVGASAVIVFGLFAPLGALVLQGRQTATRWMIAYTILLIVSLVLDPEMVIDNSLSETVVGLLFIGNIFGVAMFTFIVMTYFVGQRDRIQGELAREQEKSEDLLLNILPASVASDLKRDGRTEVRTYEEASVLFADFVGFTQYSESTPPEALVKTLNDIFTAFDRIAAKHEVEKIRTIGDAYMAASGVPTPRPDHAALLAACAIDMRDYVTGYHGVTFRIGINSGPLVAGVVGTSKFQYDIWGDTVNTASRMEATAEPGRIQISESTQRLISGQFTSERRGLVQVKGKGQMETWYLIG
jgi:guanylate cyclase